MEYALVNGIKITAAPGLKGFCPACGNEVTPRCGKIKVHHWAHYHLPDCDSWSEPETPWHRAWKARFPVEWQEVPFTDPLTLENHRADVHTPERITLEFQHSPISVTELASRNAFYQKLLPFFRLAVFLVKVDLAVTGNCLDKHFYFLPVFYGRDHRAVAVFQ